MLLSCANKFRIISKRWNSDSSEKLGLYSGISFIQLLNHHVKKTLDQGNWKFTITKLSLRSETVIPIKTFSGYICKELSETAAAYKKGPWGLFLPSKIADWSQENSQEAIFLLLPRSGNFVRKCGTGYAVVCEWSFKMNRKKNEASYCSILT